MSEKVSPQIIVLLDDEEMVLISIRSLIELETDYACVPFKSANEALDFVASSNDISLVVSDYLMPEMDGITFLAKVRQMRPDIPRILLTGYADKENAIKAINEVGLFQYIEKPWDNSDLLMIFRN
ncbi:MAG: response regulator [bacterium]|nr:response regulator [bacterium]